MLGRVSRTLFYDLRVLRTVVESGEECVMDSIVESGEECGVESRGLYH